MLVPHFLVLLVPNALNLERKTGLEPATSTLARWRSTIEPLPHMLFIYFNNFNLINGADEGSRTPTP